MPHSYSKSQYQPMRKSMSVQKSLKSLKKLMLGALFTGLSVGVSTSSMAETYQVVYHVVEANETLSGLSKDFGVSVKDIKKVNGKDNANIVVGERLLIPITKVIIDSKKVTAKGISKGAKTAKAKKNSKKVNNSKSTSQSKAKSTSKTAKKASNDTSTQKYRVKSGDTLGAIALQYGTTVAEITKANNITEDYVLMIDDLLLIPSKGNVKQVKQVTKKATRAKKTESKEETTENTTNTNDVPLVYEVVSGDVLGAIADKYKLKMADIIELNGLENGDTLSVGQKLILRKEEQPAKNYRKIAKSSTY